MYRIPRLPSSQVDASDVRCRPIYSPQRHWGLPSLPRQNGGGNAVYYNAYSNSGAHFAPSSGLIPDHGPISSPNNRRNPSNVRTGLPPVPTQAWRADLHHTGRVDSTAPTTREEFIHRPEMVALPHASSSDDELPSRRTVVRRQNCAYLQEMRNAHAEGRRARHIIHTDALGNIIDQKSQWHRAVRAVSRTELDWKIKSYKDHPEAWSYIIENIQRELNSTFVYVEKPLRVGYLEKYLSIAISRDRYNWRKHWKETGTRHHKCPQEAYDMWLPHWNSEKGRLESEAMADLRAMHKPKTNQRHNAGSQTVEEEPLVLALQVYFTNTLPE